MILTVVGKSACDNSGITLFFQGFSSSVISSPNSAEPFSSLIRLCRRILLTFSIPDRYSHWSGYEINLSSTNSLFPFFLPLGRSVVRAQKNPAVRPGLFLHESAGRLLDRDRFAGAFARAGAAADAIGFVDFGSAVFHGNRVDGAGSDAGFAAGAFALIDFCSHCCTPCLGFG